MTCSCPPSSSSPQAIEDSATATIPSKRSMRIFATPIEGFRATFPSWPELVLGLLRQSRDIAFFADCGGNGDVDTPSIGTGTDRDPGAGDDPTRAIIRGALDLSCVGRPHL